MAFNIRSVTEDEVSRLNFQEFPKGSDQGNAANNNAVKAVEFLKECGNRQFSKKNYREAEKLYSSCVSIIDESGIGKSRNSPSAETSKLLAQVYSNLSATQQNLGDAFSGEISARQATLHQPKWHRGYWRLCTAFKAQKSLDAAAGSLIHGLQQCRNEMTFDIKYDFIVEWLSLRLQTEHAFLDKGGGDYKSTKLNDLLPHLDDRDLMVGVMEKLVRDSQWNYLRALLHVVSGQNSKFQGYARTVNLRQLVEYTQKERYKRGPELALQLMVLGAPSSSLKSVSEPAEFGLVRLIVYGHASSSDIEKLFVMVPINAQTRNAERQNMADFAQSLAEPGLETQPILARLARMDIVPGGTSASDNTTGSAIGGTKPRESETTKKSSDVKLMPPPVAVVFDKNEEGIKHLNSGNYNLAIKCFNEAIDQAIDIVARVGPIIDGRTMATMYTNRASCWLDLGKTNCVEQDTRTAIRADPTYNGAYILLRDMLWDEKRFGECADVCLSYLQCEMTETDRVKLLAKTVDLLSAFCSQKKNDRMDPRFMEVFQLAVSLSDNTSGNVKRLSNVIIDIVGKSQWDAVGDFLTSYLVSKWRNDEKIPSNYSRAAVKVNLRDLLASAELGHVLYPERDCLALVAFGAPVESLKQQDEPVVFSFVRLTLLTMPEDIEEPRDFDLLQTFFDSVLRRKLLEGEDWYVAENNRKENIFDFVQSAQTDYKVVREDLLQFLGRYDIRPAKKSKTKKHSPCMGIQCYEEAQPEWVCMGKVVDASSETVRGPRDCQWFSGNHKKAKKTGKQTPSTRPDSSQTTGGSKAKTAPKSTSSLQSNLTDVISKGDSLYNDKKYREAIDVYTSALKKAEASRSASNERAMILCNRSGCYLSLCSFAEAVRDGMQATQLEPHFKIGYWRAVYGQICLNNLTGAVELLMKCQERCSLSIHQRALVLNCVGVIMCRRRDMDEFDYAESFNQLLNEWGVRFLETIGGGGATLARTLVNTMCATNSWPALIELLMAQIPFSKYSDCLSDVNLSRLVECCMDSSINDLIRPDGIALTLINHGVDLTTLATPGEPELFSFLRLVMKGIGSETEFSRRVSSMDYSKEKEVDVILEEFCQICQRQGIDITKPNSKNQNAADFIQSLDFGGPRDGFRGSRTKILKSLEKFGIVPKRKSGPVRKAVLFVSYSGSQNNPFIVRIPPSSQDVVMIGQMVEVRTEPEPMSDLNRDDLLAAIQKKKSEGNNFHKLKQWGKAVEKYTEAISLVPAEISTPAEISSRDHAVLYANRAAAFLALEMYDEALPDSEKAIALDPTFFKGYTRCVTALEQKRMFDRGANLLITCYDKCTMNLQEKQLILYDAFLNIYKSAVGVESRDRRLPIVIGKTVDLGPSSLKFIVDRLAENDLWDALTAWLYVIHEEHGKDNPDLMRFVASDLSLRNMVDVAWRHSITLTFFTLTQFGILPWSNMSNMWEPPIFGAVRLLLVMDDDTLSVMGVAETLLLLKPFSDRNDVNGWMENVADWIQRLNISHDTRTSLLTVLAKYRVHPQPSREPSARDRKLLADAAKYEKQGDQCESRQKYGQAYKAYSRAHDELQQLEGAPWPAGRLGTLLRKLIHCAVKGGDQAQVVEPLLRLNLNMDPTHRETVNLAATYLSEVENYVGAADVLLSYLVYHGRSQTDNFTVIVEAVKYIGLYYRQSRRQGKKIMITGNVGVCDPRIRVIVEEFLGPQPERLRGVVRCLCANNQWGAAESLLIKYSDYKLSTQTRNSAVDVDLSGLVQDASSWLQPSLILGQLLHHGANAQTLAQPLEPAVFGAIRLFLEPVAKVPPDYTGQKIDPNPFASLSDVLKQMKKNWVDLGARNSLNQNVADFILTVNLPHITTEMKTHCLRVVQLYGVKPSRPGQNEDTGGSAYGGEQPITRIARLKKEGNGHHTSGDYRSAVEAYTSAIYTLEQTGAALPARDQAVLYCNRAGSLIALREFNTTVNSDIETAFELDKSFPRALTRFVSLCDQQRRHDEAFQRLIEMITTQQYSDDDRVKFLIEAVVQLQRAGERAANPSLSHDEQSGLGKIVHLIGTPTQMRGVVTALSQKGHWLSVWRLLDRVRDDVEWDTVASEVILKGLIDLGEDWCLECALVLLRRGARVDTLNSESEPAIFGLVRLALVPGCKEHCFGDIIGFLPDSSIRCIHNDQNALDFAASRPQTTGACAVVRTLRFKGLKPSSTSKKESESANTMDVSQSDDADTMSLPADIAELKNQATEAYSNKKLDDALRLCTESIEKLLLCASYMDGKIEPRAVAVLYSNRAACHIEMKNYDRALEDAKQALRVDPTFSRAVTRLATIHARQDQFTEAAGALMTFMTNRRNGDIDETEKMSLLSSLSVNLLRGCVHLGAVMGQGVDNRWKKMFRLLCVPRRLTLLLEHLTGREAWRDQYLLADIFLKLADVENRGVPLGWKNCCVKVNLRRFVEMAVTVRCQNADSMVNDLFKLGADENSLAAEDEPPLFAYVRLLMYDHRRSPDSVLSAFETFYERHLNVLKEDPALVTNKKGENLADYVKKFSGPPHVTKWLLNYLKKRNIIPQESLHEAHEKTIPSKPNERASTKDPVTLWKDYGSVLHRDHKAFSDAVDAYTKAIEATRDLRIPKKDVAVLYSNRAGSRIELEQWDLALKDAQEARRLDPQFPRVYERLQRIYSAQKKYEQLANILPAYFKLCDVPARTKSIDGLVGLDDEPGKVAAIIHNLTLDVQLMQYAVEQLYRKYKFHVLYHLLKDKKAKPMNAPISKVKMEHVDLSLLSLRVDDRDVEAEVAIWMLRRGANPSTLCPWPGKPRPLSYALWIALVDENSRLFDYMLTKDCHELEPGYPRRGDAFHLIIEQCMKREAYQRTKLFRTIMKAVDNALVYDSIQTCWKDFLDVADFTVEGEVNRIVCNAIEGIRHEETVPKKKHSDEPPPPPQRSGKKKGNHGKPCIDCEKMYNSFMDTMNSRSHDRGSVYDQLCPVLEQDNHEVGRHSYFVDKCMEQIIEHLKREEGLPERLLKLPEPMYEKLVLRVYPTHWNLVIRLIAGLMWDKRTNKTLLSKLSEKLELAVFIESDFLEKSPAYRREQIKRLIDAGLSATKVSSSSGLNPLQTAGRKRDWSCVQTLIEHGADVNDFHFSDIDTPLHAALSVAVSNDGDDKLLQFLLKLYDKDPVKYACVAPSVRDDNGDTLLHAIAKVRSSAKVLKLVEFLHKLDIDPNVENKEGKMAQDCLALEDRRRRFLQASVAPDAHHSPERKPSLNESEPVGAGKLPPKDNRRIVTDFVQSMEGRIIKYFEFDISDSEGESESEDEDQIVDDTATVNDAEQQVEVEAESATDSEDDDLPDVDIDITSDIFDKLEWEVDCTDKVWRTLLNKKLDRNLKMNIVKKIRRLASGDWQPSLCKKLKYEREGQTEPIQLYEIKLTRGMRIIWEVAIAFSQRLSESASLDDNKHRIYAEIIRVWDVVMDHGRIYRSVRQITRSNARGEQSIIRKRLCGIEARASVQTSASNKDKVLPSLFMEKTDSQEKVKIWTPPASSNENEYHIMKFYALNTAMVKYILEHDGTKQVDFPFNVTDIEFTYIHLNPEPPSPLLILGRSGTGKTTCCLYRLWVQFLNYWNKACLAEEPLLARQLNYRSQTAEEDEEEEESDSDDVEGDGEDSDESPEVEYDHLHQIFVTKNRVLTREVKKNFLRLCQSNKAAQSFTDCATLPVSFQNVSPTSYPLFLTSRQFLLILDGSMPKPFFKRDSAGNMKYDVDGWGAKESKLSAFIHSDSSDDDDEDEAGMQAASVSAQSSSAATRKEVTYDIFAHKLWSKLMKKDKKKRMSTLFHPSLVWMEIVSFIKGSIQALKSPNGYLSLEEYHSLGKKQAPHFKADRNQVYDIFRAYQIVCKQDGYFDECDVVHNIYHRLLTSKHHTEWVIHQVFVDEVQDFTQSELCLLIQLCHDPNTMFFTGDTAQSIMRGVAFRFSDLKTLFHSVRESMQAVGYASRAVGVPKQVYKLTQNYRSHAGVIRLANSIITLLKEFFPHSFDHAKSDEDVALFEGPKPVMFDSAEFNDLALVLRRNKREGSHIEFGTHQVIIVVNDEARENIPEVLEHCLVLTIYESKGLEFDDVLLFNFFKDSEATSEWRVVSDYLQHLVEGQSSSNADNTGFIEIDLDVLRAVDRSHPLEFNPEKHKILNSELKHLYTAITRARVNVWIYDEDTTARKPMFEYFKARKLVRTAALHQDQTGDTLGGKTSTKQEWRRMGKDFYRKDQFLPAAKCFRMSGDDKLEKICKAHDCAQKAQRKPPALAERRVEFLSAARLYLDCKESGLYDKAALCLKNARELVLAAKVYRHIGKFKESAALFRRGNKPELAVWCYEQLEQYDEVVKFYCDQKQYTEALRIWRLYEQKVKDYERTGDRAKLEKLQKHRPHTRYEPKKITYKLAEVKLAKDDVIGACDVLSELGLSEDEIAVWLAAKGKQKSAAVMLEREGKLIEAATRYRDVDDYASAIACLDRCKDLTTAKRQLADCYVTMCKRYVSSTLVRPDFDSGADGQPLASVSRKYRTYMDEALKLLKELKDHKNLAECLLLEAIVRDDRKYYYDALDQFCEASVEIGQIEAVFQISKKWSLTITEKTKVIKSVCRVWSALKKESGTEYIDLVQFYGLDDDRVDTNSRLHQLYDVPVGEIEHAEAMKYIKKDLTEKTESILGSIARECRSKVVAVTPCASLDTAEQCNADCPYLHQKLSKSHVIRLHTAMTEQMCMHDVLLDTYLTNEDFRDLLNTVEDLDFSCSDKFLKLILWSETDYATTMDEVCNVFEGSKIWEASGQAEAAMDLLLRKTEVKYLTEEELKEASRNTDVVLQAMYTVLVCGEVHKTGRVDSIYTYLRRLEWTTKGNSEGDFWEGRKWCNFFKFCVHSYGEHYYKRDPFTAMKTCNRFLTAAATKSRTTASHSLLPSMEVILPIFILQFFRGMLLYVKASPDTPAFFPESYLRILNVMDFLCTRSPGMSTLTIVKNFRLRSQTFHTTVRQQLRVLCEVFLGIRSEKFNMLKMAAKSTDEKVLEWAIVFSLVMIINAGLSIDENISINDYGVSSQRTKSVSLEEVIMEELMRVVERTKSRSPKLSLFCRSIIGSRGLRDIAVLLEDFLASSGSDRLVEATWSRDRNSFVIEDSTSHLTMDTGFLKYKPGQTSEAYKVLEELHKGDLSQQSVVDESEDSVPIPIQEQKKAEDEDEPFEDDPAVSSNGCDLCTVTDFADGQSKQMSNEGLRRSHIRSEVHKRNRKLYDNYLNEVGELTDWLREKVPRIESRFELAREELPDQEVLHQRLKDEYESFKKKESMHKRNKNWKASGGLTMLANEIKRDYEELEKKILDTDVIKGLSDVLPPPGFEARDEDEHRDEDEDDETPWNPAPSRRSRRHRGRTRPSRKDADSTRPKKGGGKKRDRKR